LGSEFPNIGPPAADSNGSISPLARQIAEFSAEVASFQESGAAPLTDHLARWLAAHCIVAARAAARDAGPDGIALDTLRSITADVVALRRGDHYAERLRIEREQLELDRQRTGERLEKYALEWARKPENKRKFCGPELSMEERVARMRKIFGLAPTPKLGLSEETLRILEKELKLL